MYVGDDLLSHNTFACTGVPQHAPVLRVVGVEVNRPGGA